MAKHPSGNLQLPHGVVLLYEDEDILVVDKPGGLLTISTAKEAERTAYWVAMDYVRGGIAKSRNRIFVVHRLDRETSGLLLFARNERAKRQLQDNWEQARKTYLALVDGHPPTDSGIEESRLLETTALRVYSTDHPTQGALARTAWRILRKTPRMSLLEVDLLTGRKHQIRVHLSEMGHPIIGDAKYGVPGRGRDRSERSTEQAQSIRSPMLALHSWRLEFPHPTTGQVLSFEAPLPRSIAGFIGGNIGSAQGSRSGEDGLESPAGESHPQVRPDFAMLTVSRKGRIHRRTREVELADVVCRLIYPTGEYIDAKTKEPYTGPWPDGFDPANPPMPRGWTLTWPPPGNE
jgi:tRNA pseudouridine32 synthase/23S rRNA pseudouridine746 synthase/23S rRNA pseudouridine1911/1915/1917 synthase